MSQLIKFGGAILLTLLPISAESSLSPTSPPSTALYCACCAEAGTWEHESRKFYGNEIETLNALKLDGVARFYTTAAWPDDVRGVAPPMDDLDEELVISLVRDKVDWKLFFKTKAGRTGALVLTMPANATFFNADLGEGAGSEPRETITIYKEIRLEGAVRATGIFAKGIAPRTKFRLVLQGRGNRCLSAEDFYRWNLRISGPLAKYAIYGSLAKH